MNVLVLAAHPDDEVLGCGGTIARLASEGARVSVLILANGLTSRPGFDQAKASSLLQVHHERAQKAGALLGVAEVHVAGFPDQRMDTVPLLEIVQVIEREITRTQPDWLFTQHGGDLNLDHAITFRAALTATRPCGGCPVKRVLSYEVGSSTEWAFTQFEPHFTPQVFFDISAFLDRKLSAMQVYSSEVRAFPHPRSPEAIRAAAQRWGSTAGIPAAEAFCLIREIL